MKIISHRGNLNGPDETIENTECAIDHAISLGFDVEIDLRYYHGAFYLGHDEPQYQITLEWIHNRRHFLWIHCKDLDSFAVSPGSWNKFCHTQDPVVAVLPNKMWVHDLNLELNWKCIIPLLSREDIFEFDLKRLKDCYGVCTDYPFEIEAQLNELR